MPFGRATLKLDKYADSFRRLLRYSFLDWTGEMSRSKRIITYVGILLQGYAFYFMLMWALMPPKWLAANLLFSDALLPKP